MIQIQEAETCTLDVTKLGTVVAVWAHPDDEAFLAGGLMALAAEAASGVVCVTATRGEHGPQTRGGGPLLAWVPCGSGSSPLPSRS